MSNNQFTINNRTPIITQYQIRPFGVFDSIFKDNKNKKDKKDQDDDNKE